MPERSLLCLKRNVGEQGQWAFGKEFIAILRERPLPKIEGRGGAFFCIYWGWVSGDSDGPVEWCRPVPQTEAHALAGHYTELTLRTEPAHREAFVALPAGPDGISAVHFQPAVESLEAWKHDLVKRYGSTMAVNDLSFSIRPGMVTGFLGPNGAGKTTTMRMILGLDAPTQGSVTVGGRSYRDLPAPMREVGALPDAPPGGRAGRRPRHRPVRAHPRLPPIHLRRRAALGVGQAPFGAVDFLGADRDRRARRRPGGRHQRGHRPRLR
jgi:ABC transporter